MSSDHFNKIFDKELNEITGALKIHSKGKDRKKKFFIGSAVLMKDENGKVYGVTAAHNIKGVIDKEIVAYGPIYFV